MINPLIFICFISPFIFSTQVLVAVDILYPNQSILDNGRTLISASQTFELGFFTPWNSNNRYLGIWFKNVPIQTVVWVANRDNPVTDSSGVITITTIGNIIISSNQTNIIWNSNSASTRGSNPVLQLLDSGNLVLRNINSDNYFWQSFDHPCDALIPGMKLGWNLQTNQEWYLTSWRSSQDPATGGYTYRLNPHGLPEIVLRLGSHVQFRSGPWDGVRFGGSPKQSQNSVLKSIYVFDEENAFYAFQNYDVSIISRFVLNQSGMVQFLTWRQRRNEWVVIATMQEDTCDKYAVCGNHGVCTLNGNPICDCLDGFVPRLPQDWERLDWSGGCYRRTPLNCSATEGFKKFSNLKLPDNSNFLVNSTSVSTPVECEEACLRNCSCTAYAVTEVSGCAVWFGDLVDIRTYSEDGQDIYIRMPASELVESSSNRAKRTALIASATVVVFILGLIIWYVLRKRNTAKKGDKVSNLII